jgi:hypothetical protein
MESAQDVVKGDVIFPGRHVVEDWVALWMRRTEVPTTCRYRSGTEVIEGILRGIYVDDGTALNASCCEDRDAPRRLCWSGG